LCLSPSGSSGKVVALCSAAARAARRHRKAVAVRRGSVARGTRAAHARRMGRRVGQGVSGGCRGEISATTVAVSGTRAATSGRTTHAER